MWRLDGVNGMCPKCAAEAETRRAALLAALPERKSREELALKERSERASQMILTTETSASDLIVSERLGVVAAECVFGMHLFKDMFAEVRDLFGGRSQAVQNTLKDARKVALEELRSEAADLGADAVIGVDLDYSEISGGGKSMLFLVASGTAVKLSKA
jgi:uncharacterized protein YbjQ (UPF0145 family)